MVDWKIDIPNDCIVTRKGYEISGRVYYRVTQVLGVIAKHGLMNWYQKVGKTRAEAIVKDRQIHGTKMHKLFELILKNEEIDLTHYSEEIKEDVEIFHEFIKNTKLKPEALEQKLWSNKYGFAGTADYVGSYTSDVQYLVRGHKPKFTKEAFVIGDWKSSKAIYRNYILQLTAYAFAFEELTGKKVDGVFIVMFRYGKCKVKEMTREEILPHYEAFKAVLETYEWNYKLGEWKERE